MSLLLDALKKSEAQRRRGASPTIDLTRTPSSGGPRRPAARWLFVAPAGVLLVAAAPWLWPPVSDWLDGRRGADGDDPAAEVAINLPSGERAMPSGGRAEAVPVPGRTTAATVAGASSARRVADADESPAIGTTGQTPAPTENDSERASSNSSGNDEDTSDAIPSAPEGGVSSTASSEPPSQTRPEPSPPVAEPVENFIRPWQLPQAQRAEFPELRLSVHFFAERAADRFVLINGERYTEGQRVGPGTRLVEIRQRGAVVDFGSYRVLIE